MYGFAAIRNSVTLVSPFTVFLIASLGSSVNRPFNVIVETVFFYDYKGLQYALIGLDKLGKNVNFKRGNNNMQSHSL